MRNKLAVLFALTLCCLGAFLFPVTAQAAEGSIEPPAITASDAGDILCIETAAGYYGVEAVFINETRFNYRVDSVLTADARDWFGDDSETVSVYAIDFAGNKSNVVTLDNPYYAPPEPPKEANPFTPDGQAEVMDQADEGDGKIFYTFTTPEGNVFYLVIDRERDSDNVYFLNAVTENDLYAIAEKGGGQSAIPTPEPPPPTPEPTETEPPAEEPLAKEGGSGLTIFLVLALIAAGGAGYYFKILRPKQQAAAAGDYDDDPEDDRDYPYEDDPDEDEQEDDDGQETPPEEAEDEQGEPDDEKRNGEDG
jgi:hypothetical protein